MHTLVTSTEFNLNAGEAGVTGNETRRLRTIVGSNVHHDPRTALTRQITDSVASDTRNLASRGEIIGNGLREHPDPSTTAARTVGMARP
jgi:hypothetical protein